MMFFSLFQSEELVRETFPQKMLEIDELFKVGCGLIKCELVSFIETLYK